MVPSRMFSKNISILLCATILMLALFTPNTAFADKKYWDFDDYLEQLSHIKPSPALVVAIDGAINNAPRDAINFTETKIDLLLWKLRVLAQLNDGKAAVDIASNLQKNYTREDYSDDRHYGRTMYQIVESLGKTNEIGYSYGVIQNLRESVYEKPNTFLEFIIDRCLIEVYIETFDYKRALAVSLFVLNHPDYQSIEDLQSHYTATINEVAFLYNKLGDGKNALTYIELAEKSLEDTDLIDDKLLKAQARNAGNRARAYLHLGKNEEAGILGHEVLKAAKELDSKYMIALGHRLIGSAAYRQGEYEEAIQSFEAGLALVDENNIFIMKQPFYKNYAASLEAAGRYEEALIWQKKLNKLQIDIYAALKTTREKLNDVEFDAFKSHQEVEKLRQVNEAQREKYANEKDFRKLLIILVISLFAAAAFLISLIFYMRKTQKMLRISEQNAQIANKAKSEFLATMSHEIRTPMNGVMGMAQILQNTKLTSQQRHYVDIMTRSGENLLVIINDILDFSKIEANKLDLSLEPHNLEQTLNDVICLLENKAESKSIKMNLNYDPDLPKNFLIDSHRLSQVFTNLIGNAIKFTPKGEINVTVRQKKNKELGKNTAKSTIEIRVKDSGIGISKEKLKVIFDKFTQAESSTTRNYGGTGLGLAISRRIVEAMDGSLSVTSKLGKGSTFMISLPLKTAEDDASTPVNDIKPSKAPSSLSNDITAVRVKTKKTPSPTQPMRQKAISNGVKGIQILVAEDDEINITVIKSMLNHPKISLTIAKNGKEALRVYNQQAYDLILMDVSMPVMDGVCATKTIREKEAMDGSRRTPIICLSAHVMDHQREEFIEAGMDDCLPKPIQKKQLLAAIGRWLKTSRADQQAPQSLAS